MMNLKYLCYVLSLLTHGSISQKYIGCYNDEGPVAAGGGGRAMTLVSSDNTFTGCIQACSAYNYFALQNGLSCWCGNDLSQITRYGEYDGHGWNAYARSNCYTLQSNTVGGAYTNALYEYTAEPTPAPTSSPTTFTGCNNSGNKDRRIGIRTTIAQYAGTNTLVLASIYSNGAWSIWKGLDNSGCDDFQEGSVDYFDDFEDITSEWEAVALYNCGNDGLMIEDVYYWDGSQQIMLWGWSSGVFGPFNKQCLKNYISSRGVYSDIWIKGTDCGCEGVVFQTADALGAVWTGSTPNAPPCSILVQTESQQAPVAPATIPNPSKYAPYLNTNSDFEEKLVDYLMTVIGIAALLFVSNSCLITVMVKKGLRNPQYEYGKVYKTDME